MWWLSRAAGAGILLVLSWIDIRIHQVPEKLLICSSAAAVMYHLAVRQMNIWVIAGGAGVGMLFLLLSRATREGIGYGDSWAILILGIYLGLWKLVEVLCTAFVILGIYSAVILYKRKMSHRAALPFFPFLTAGYVLAAFI